MSESVIRARSAHAALALVAAVYGINYIWAKDVMPHWVEPSAFILLRVSGASLLFALLRFKRWRILPEKKDIPRLFFSGLLGVAGNQLLFFNGLNLTYPVNASIIMTITPLLVVVLGVLVGQEILNRQRLLGFLLAGAGAVGLIVLGKELSGIQSHPLGDVMVLLNASMYAGYLVVVQPLMKKYRPVDVIQWVFFFGLLIVIPFGWNGVGEIEWRTLPDLIIAKVVFVVIATTFLVYLLNLFALSVLGSSTVGLYIYLQPVLATTFAVLSGMENPHPTQLGLGLVVILGVLIGSWKRRHRGSRKGQAQARME